VHISTENLQNLQRKITGELLFDSLTAGSTAPMPAFTSRNRWLLPIPKPRPTLKLSSSSPKQTVPHSFPEQQEQVWPANV
jgi:hypothetical protein